MRTWLSKCKFYFFFKLVTCLAQCACKLVQFFFLFHSFLQRFFSHCFVHLKRFTHSLFDERWLLSFIFSCFYSLVDSSLDSFFVSLFNNLKLGFFQFIDSRQDRYLGIVGLKSLIIVNWWERGDSLNWHGHFGVRDENEYVWIKC